MRRYAYFAPFVLFIPAFAAMLAGGAITWFLPLFTFVVVPIAEQWSRGSQTNLSAAEEADALVDRLYDVVLYLVVPAQLLLLAAFLWRLHHGGYATWEIAGATATMGIACGTFGINVAHELGHHRRRVDQALARVLLATSLYMHFFVEHNRGHHRRVATPDDPATSRRGESVYTFWSRSISGGLRSAWSLESQRLSNDGRSAWSWSNEVLRGLVIEGAMLVAIGAVAGPAALIGFVLAASGGVLLLETVNYVEHYGLLRARNGNGGYERVRPEHSWNSERAVGRILLFELTRHSDHHANSTRPYQILRHHDAVPELPAGYPAMIVLALVPPLFRALMERSLERWHVTSRTLVAA